MAFPCRSVICYPHRTEVFFCHDSRSAYRIGRYTKSMAKNVCMVATQDSLSRAGVDKFSNEQLAGASKTSNEAISKIPGGPILALLY